MRLLVFCIFLAFLFLKTDPDGVKDFFLIEQIPTTKQKGPNLKYGIQTCYIINLKSQRDRLAAVIAELDKYDLSGTLIDAVNSKDIDIISLKNKGIYETDLKYGEMTTKAIACDLSHHKALKEIAKRNDSFPSIILEDDIVFQDNFNQILSSLKTDHKTIVWDVIMLGCKLSCGKKQLKETSVPYLFKSGMVLGTWAYMVTPRSARKILQDIYPIRNPIDTVITVPEPPYTTEGRHDPRFIGKINRLVVYTGKTFRSGTPLEYDADERIGIVNELSTLWNFQMKK